VAQRCQGCRRFQWGPEWICHRCHSFDLAFEEVEPTGTIYAWERSWHPVHPDLVDAGPYLVVLVELAHADGIRMIGNLLGDPLQPVTVGEPVVAEFEDHEDYTLVQWRRPAADPPHPAPGPAPA
jgi:uncharacterized OB-fold protein